MNPTKRLSRLLTTVAVDENTAVEQDKKLSTFMVWCHHLNSFYILINNLSRSEHQPDQNSD